MVSNQKSSSCEHEEKRKTNSNLSTKNRIPNSTKHIIILFELNELKYGEQEETLTQQECINRSFIKLI